MSSSPCRWPAIPLITIDPYFSVWNCSDRLNTDHTRHWTGTEHPLLGALSVDGKRLMFCGLQPTQNLLTQTSVTVDPTVTTYTFAQLGVALRVRFFNPLLLDDLDLLSRPVAWVDFEVASTDGAAHEVVLDFAASPLLASNLPGQEVITGHCTFANVLKTVRAGTKEQAILTQSGDDLRIEWGHVHLLAPEQPALRAVGLVKPWDLFCANQAGVPFPPETDLQQPARQAHLLAARFCNIAAPGEPLRAHCLIAYDDLNAAIEVFGQRVPGYWARNGMSFEDMLLASARNYTQILERCLAFDLRMNAACHRAGGAKYRDLCALAYRQSIAAHKLVADADGQPEFYSKECFSNGCMGTVDVSYPSIPLFLHANPELVKGMMRPVLRYARMPDWPFGFAPHDVGRYPLANGQSYGRDGKSSGEHPMEAQMPVEECGNMLIMFAADAHYTGVTGFAEENWDLIEKWARYLVDVGIDPGEQLCTDDFAGHLAHNANLAIKATVGVAAYARLCDLTGRPDVAASAWQTARRMAGEWEALARDEVGHFRLAYDQPGSWSLKYNWLWDVLLGFSLFTASVIERELQSYGPRFLPYGIPLDSRSLYTKSDWMLWCAALESHPERRARWIEPIWAMLNDTPHRVPFTDWYFTDTSAQAGFQNRSVQGGLFSLLLKDSSR